MVCGKGEECWWGGQVRFAKRQSSDQALQDRHRPMFVGHGSVHPRPSGHRLRVAPALMWNGLSSVERDFLLMDFGARQIKGKGGQGSAAGRARTRSERSERSPAATLEGPVSGLATMGEEAHRGFLGAPLAW